MILCGSEAMLFARKCQGFNVEKSVSLASRTVNGV